jgi:hypothetical protein
MAAARRSASRLLADADGQRHRHPAGRIAGDTGQFGIPAVTEHIVGVQRHLREVLHTGVVSGVVGEHGGAQLFVVSTNVRSIVIGAPSATRE